MSANKQVLIVVTSHDQIPATGKATGLWLEEFATPYTALQAAGVAITVASPKGCATPIDPNSLGEEPNGEVVAVLQQTVPLTTVQATDFNAIFLPGGHGTMFDLPHNAALQTLLRDFDAQSKVIAAVCHGPAGLVGATRADGTLLIAGKRVTGFTNAEEDAAGLSAAMPFLLESELRNAGGIFEGADLWAEHVVQDGNLITGQNPQSSATIVQTLIAALIPVTG